MSLPQSESLEVDLAALAQTLERIRPQISPEDHRCLQEATEALVELTRLIRDRNTTIARLRRMLEGSISEKTADVCGEPSSSEAGLPAQGSEPETPAAGDPCAPGDSADGNPARSDGAKRRLKGHGRIPAASYPRARRVRVAHPTLHAGDPCPDCSRGKLHRLPVRAEAARRPH